MSHYEERLEKDLAHIRGSLADLASAVERAYGSAAKALFSGDDKLAYAVVLEDLAINRASRELDRICHGFFAVHLPSAGHLRFVSSAMRVNLQLERIGDYAVNICRESVQIGQPPKGAIGQEMQRMAEEAQDALSRALAAFNDGDSDQAKINADQASRTARSFSAVFKSLVNEEGNLRVEELFYYLVIFNMFSRVVDQAKNICEETVFTVTGQTKPAKSYRVLFLDEDNSALGPMAQAIAGHMFPQSGEYASAGRQPASAINGDLARFLAERGIPLTALSPKKLDPSAAELADYHVIVSLQGPIKSYVDPPPFHPIALEWEVGELPAGTDQAENTAQFEALYRSLALQVRDLMTALHGEEAP